MINPTQQKILSVLQVKGRVTSSDISTALRVTQDTAGRNLRLLVDMGYIHIAGQDDNKSRMPSNIYALGFGDDETSTATKLRQQKQNAARKAFNKRNLYDISAPIMPNTGWVSTIHSRDYVMQHGDHIKFMERFKPHADHASEWLFNNPKVELLGARYDLVQG
jgi:DNA-binding transcriptional ArsR family regulator